MVRQILISVEKLMLAVEFGGLLSLSLETATRLAQLGERQSAEREAVGSNPGRTNTQGL